VRLAAEKKKSSVRLLRRGGAWSLEFTRLVAVDDQLMRPERRSIAATPDALKTVAPSCPPERVREAQALMGEADDGSERVFELAEDGWAPAPRTTHSQRPLVQSDLRRVVAELTAELVGLRALHDALLLRVVSLEQSGAEARRVEAPPRAVSRVPSRRELMLSLQGGDGIPVSPRPSAAEPPRTLAAPEAPVVAATAAAVEETPSGPRLALPSQGDVVSCVQMLAPDVELELVKAPVPSDLTELHAAALATETGDVLGVVLVDQRARASLGGGLLGMPRATREEQGRRGLDNDVIEAFNEVLNNLGGLVNRANPECYTRLGGLERAEALPWLAKPGKKLGFSLAGGGALWLLAR